MLRQDRMSRRVMKMQNAGHATLSSYLQLERAKICSLALLATFCNAKSAWGLVPDDFSHAGEDPKSACTA